MADAALLLLLAIARTLSAASPRVLHYEASDRLLSEQCATRDTENKLLKGGWTALTLAAELGDEEAIRQNLEDGANVDVPDESGRSALSRACFHGHDTAVAALLEAGASVYLSNSDGSTPMRLAAQRGNANVVRLLLNASIANAAAAEAADDDQPLLALPPGEASGEGGNDARALVNRRARRSAASVLATGPHADIGWVSG